MNLKNFKITNKGLYWGLIITFALLYLCVGFVSTLHSITFFNLANTIGLAILLGLTYEIGQASVLFSILMTNNKDKFLPWLLMFLLTALQVTANVYASFKYMVKSGSNDWVYWQKSILFSIQAPNAEMNQIIISWIAGALLPIVALGMTALVAQNIKLMSEENEVVKSISPKEIEDIINNEVEKRISEKNLNKDDKKINYREDDDIINDLLDKEVERMIPVVEDKLPKSDEKKQKKENTIIEPLDLNEILESLNSTPLSDEQTSNENNFETFEPTTEIYDEGLPYINDGVEVIDAKAIEKDLNDTKIKKN